MIAFILLLSILIILVYFLAIKPFNYWRERGVKTERVIPVFGDNFGVMFGLESFIDQTKRMYNTLPNERYYGLYQFSLPTLVIRTPDLIKKLCVKDFEYFLNRRNLTPEGCDVLFSKNLINLKGQSWKDMRSTLSPTFTSSKMKSMFVLICHNAKLFTEHFLEKKEDLIEVEFKDSICRFTSDVIASSAFGLQVDSLKDRNNTFFKMGRESLDFTSIRLKIAFCIYQVSPKLASILKIPIITKKVQDFFINLVKDTLRMREEKNIKRPDVLGLLLDARKGQLDTKEDQEEEDGGFAVVKEQLEMKTLNCELTDLDIAAQAFLFFLAGFEGVATLICQTVYEMAINPDVQKKLIDEIDENWPEDDKPSYNKVMNMTYLDMVVSEALRKWPNGIQTDRVVTKEYTIEPELPGDKPLTLEEGSILLIPILGMHYDPKYFPNPEKFDPERFSPENKHNIDPYTYMPFGIGPRNCIGSRFALMEVKALLFYLFRHFEVVPIEKTEIPIKFNKNAFGFIPENGYHLGLKKRTMEK
ncbi:cytochrome P450 9e2-like [Harmonia axyridis]|uniref:cytochrome P450 9e2-like n=1 Tax=Harmonia axyridis TaxID=115357 RepID=UPI001E278763|nr:cytochrome P450 9e2-like [Harmonia axyridis]